MSSTFEKKTRQAYHLSGKKSVHYKTIQIVAGFKGLEVEQQ